MSQEETPYDVLRRLGAPESLILAYEAEMVGRLVYHPAVSRRARIEERRKAIRNDPSGDVKEIARRYGLSPTTVYAYRS